MDPQKQEEVYNEFFQIWKKEVSTDVLTEPPKNHDIIRDVRDLFQVIKNQYTTSNLSIAKMVYNKLLNNIDYMINDFLEIRSKKILNSAKTQTQINPNKLFSYEEKFYEQISMAYKGFSKVKKMHTASTHSDIDDVHSHEKNKDSTFDNNKIMAVEQDDIPSVHPSHQEVTASESVDNDIDISEILLGNDSSTSSITSSPLSTESHNSTTHFPKHTPVSNNESQLKPRKAPRSPTETADTKEVASPDKDLIVYQTLRIVKSYPPVVGEDFKIYGPFKTEDIVYLPKRNAEILIQEQIGELIHF